MSRHIFILQSLGLLVLAGCGGTTMDPGVTPEPPPGAPLPWVTPVVHGVNVQQVIFRSAAAAADVSFHLYLPDAYADEPDRRFPVIYWLHGAGSAIAGVGPLAAIIHGAIRDGVIPPLVVVFPNGLPLGMWVNSLDGRQPVETILMEELIPLVDQEFRTLGHSSARILDGFSMGGYGAGRLGFRYPERFAAISMLGAGPLQLDFLAEGPRSQAMQRERAFQEVFGGSQEYFEAMSPWRLAEALAHRDPPGPGIPLRVLVGSDDELLGLNRRFRGRLVELGIPHAYQEIPGVPHAVPPLIQAMGDGFWAFYRNALTLD